MKIAIGYTFAKRWEQIKYSNNNIKETIAYLEELVRINIYLVVTSGVNSEEEQYGISIRI